QDRMTQGVPDASQAKAPGLGQVSQFLGKRLDISQRGLAVLRRQLQAGNLADAELTLDSLPEELGLLRQRLENAHPEQGKSQPEAARKGRALLVEDNANERELLATFLRISGLDVVTAGDGCDALDYLHSHRLPDLVLLDMGLPRCDGPTVVREIRR